MNGPAGLADLLAAQTQDRTKDHQSISCTDSDRNNNNIDVDNEKKKKRTFVALILENSFLCQVFEVFACGWSTDLANYKALTNSEITKERIEKYSAVDYTFSEI
eukprot:11727037-Ditylum_brightwellii.AAC.1